MSGTIFTGLGDLYGSQRPNNVAGLQQLKIFPGQVVDICMDESSPLYQSPRDIGKIRFRDLVTEYNRAENELVKQAYPLDRSFARYPLPGEEVIIYRAFGEATGPSALVMANLYFYSFVVSAMHTITSNINPFIGTDSYHIDKQDASLTYDQAKTRFDKKLKSINSVKDGSNKTKVYKQLTPNEGDFILQGRFGNSIRFGSNKPKNVNAWSSKGVEGDGIIVFRVDRDYATDEKSMMVSEDIDKDDASIYMCTSQNVSMLLACSSQLKSWKTVYNLNDDANAAAGRLTNQKDSSELWSKVNDITKPSQFVNPNS